MKRDQAARLFAFCVALATCLFSTLPAESAHLANANKRGLHARSFEDILRYRDDQIDIGTAALIISEEWSDGVSGLHYRAQLDEMAQEILRRLKEKNLRPNFKAIPIINHYLFEELGFSAVPNADNPDDLFLHSVLDKRKGYCLSLSILYLALAERVGLPVCGVVVPGHFFVRYDSRAVRLNIETTAKGGKASDQHYITTRNVPADEYHSLYMKNLTEMETLGCLLNNLGVVYMDAGQHRKALTALDRAVQINPMLSESRANMGTIYLRRGEVREAIIQFKGAL